MTFYELAPALQGIIKTVTKYKEQDIQDGFLNLSQGSYAQIFWQLYDRSIRDEMGKQVSAKDATELIHQLNQYILANRSRLDQKFNLKNPILIKRPKPPLRQEYSQDLPELDQLDQRLLKDPDLGNTAIISDLGAVKNAQFYIGQLLYTAARFGGLIRADLIKSLMLNLRSGSPVIYRQVVWFRLTGNISEAYQWLPDPVSCTLLSRYYKLRTENCWTEDPGFKQLNWLSCLRFFFKKSGSKNLHRLNSNQLFALLKARLSLTHTPCHLPVMSGEEPNLTLAPDCFMRLLGRQQLITVDNEASDDRILDELAKDRTFPIIASATTDCDAVMKTVKRELSAFTKQSKKAFNENSDSGASISLKTLSGKLKALAKNDSHSLLPITTLLIEWAAVRLTSQNKWSSKLRPSNLASYLGSIFEPLSNAFKAHNPVLFDTNTLDERYMEIIEEAPKLRGQMRRAKILRDFQLFLEREYNIAPSYVCSTMVMQGSRKIPLMVDAHILMPSEYKLACEQLLRRSNLSTKPHKEYIRLLLLILGFRCGLRRREALFLLTTDLHTPGDKPLQVSHLTELLVRPHETRQLKSNSSERRIPLGTFLSATEREWFNEYLKLNQHRFEKTRYLFSDDTLNKPLDADGAFTPMVKLLKEVTKDSGFRYHRLRHSFVSWTFWYWQQHKYENDHPLKPFLKHEEMEHLPQARMQYFSQPSNAGIRGELHAISAMAGHASPSMTLLHYLHSMQWCYTAECWRDYSLNSEVTARLLNIPRRTFFDRKDKLGIVALLNIELATWCENIPDVLEETSVDSTETKNFYQDDANAKDVHEFYHALHIFNYLTENNLINSEKESCYDDKDCSFLTESGLPKSCSQNSTDSACIWAAERGIDPEIFSNAVSLLNLRKCRKNRAIRPYKDARTKQTYISNISRYVLPKWPKDAYAIRTTNLLICAFKALPQDKQIQVLNIGRFIVMDRFISWNNCQFRKPEKLWQFVKYLTPIIKLLPNDYFVHIDILNKSAIESENRKPITSAWQIPNDIEIPLQMKHTVYPDAKGKGYAALTLRTVPKQPLERYIGDHGFHVAMTALYFYYGKALERDVSNSSDKSTANKLYVITQVVTSADITNETQYAQKINEPVEDSLTDKDVLSAIDTASNIDDVKDDKCSDNTDDDDVIQYLTDPSILSSDELNPKKKRRRRKSNDSFDGIPDDLDFDWSEEQE